MMIIYINYLTVYRA